MTKHLEHIKKASEHIKEALKEMSQAKKYAGKEEAPKRRK